MTLIYLVLGWVAGMVAASRTDIDPRISLGIATLTALIAVWIFYSDKVTRVVVWMLVFFFLGFFRFDIAQPEQDKNHVSRLNDRGQLTLHGTVVEEPEVLDTRLQILVEADKAAGELVDGRVLLYADRTSKISYGDEIEAFGTLRTPPEIDEFDYRNYLARQKIFSMMPGADVTVLSTDNGFFLYEVLFDLKANARDFINESLQEPQASLLVGILLGDDNGLSEAVEEDFIITGTSHVIAISGFNMVILAQVLMSILRRFTKEETAAFLGVIAIIIYTIFVGAGAAVVRAAVMSCILIIAQALHRKTHLPTSLAFVALFLSLLNPYTLWDVGFQLSFAAVIGMAVFVPPMERGIEKFFNQVSNREISQKILAVLTEPLIVTLAAQITTLPLILFYFGRLSVVSPVVNFIIIPFQPLILLFGAIGVIIGLMVAPLGELILTGTWLFLSITVEVIDFFASLSFADTELQISAVPVIIFFSGLLVWVLYQSTRPRWAMQIAGNFNAQIPLRVVQVSSLIALALVFSGMTKQPDGRFHASFLNVGNGNGVLIESPRGGIILVDGGEFPSRLLNELGEKLPPRSRHIDVLVITAPDPENIAALPEVIDRYKIGVALITGQDSDLPEYQAILSQLEEKEVPIVVATAGYTLTTDDGIELEVIYPFTVPEADAENASMVLRVTYDLSIVLLTGNINAEIEAELLKNPHLIQSNVLQVPNHGDGDSSSQAFLEVAQPQVSIIHLDAANQRGRPSPTVIDRLSSSRLFRTDQHGTIEIVLEGDELWILTDE